MRWQAAGAAALERRHFLLQSMAKTGEIEESTVQHGQVVLRNQNAQAAIRVILPGVAEGGSENRHQCADQWLYVVSGSGTATVNGKHHPVCEGTLMLIKRGDKQEISSTGDAPLRTLNFFVPPAHSLDGGALPPGQS